MMNKHFAAYILYKEEVNIMILPDKIKEVILWHMTR